MPTLVWFRSDLRPLANPALHHAARTASDGVVGVFVCTPRQWRQHDWGANRIAFQLEGVRALRADLARLNIPLLVLTVDDFPAVPAALTQLVQQLRATAVYANREYEVNEQARDAAVAQQLQALGCAWHVYDDQTVLPPDAVRSGSGTFYKVYTPYRRRWEELVTAQLPLRILPAPKPQTLIKLPAALRPLADHWPDEAASWTTGHVLAQRWPAGSAAAQTRLKQFITQHIDSYQQQRDFPALDGTSSLSPYLASGALSVQQCLHAALRANDGQLTGGKPGVTTWIGELIWREFYRHVLVGFPRVCRNQPFNLATRRVAWRQDETQFAAWCAGRTGIPIIDAALRQLLTTGWMHNRLRMIVAMYLTKDLLIDWRWGERFFMQHLVDGDFANNNGGWQWSASTGTDAAPYFRIFNPSAQSERFDPQGNFLRQWLPELRQLDNKALHDPNRLPPLVRSTLDYPAPLVERALARQRALDAFAVLKQS